MSGVHEECGVVGIYAPQGEDIVRFLYYGLLSLQHRGQEACGIAVTDTGRDELDVNCIKDLGLVSEVFSKETLAALNGNLGIGHVRYSTTGESVRENTQPLVLNYCKGKLSLAHNGNIVNTDELREELIRTGAIFHTTMDSELIAFHIAKNRVHSKSVEEAVYKTAKKLKGAYGLVIMSPKKLIAVRDPFGIRPLCLGRRGKTYIVASESCALNSMGAEFIRDIEPGEIVTITEEGITSNYKLKQETKAHCVFEYIYFARLDSVIDGIKVYDARIKAGELLYKRHPVDADIVTGVPESGIAAAKGFAKASGIPFDLAFHKNSYIGRTFIKPSQSERSIGVQMKLSVLEEVVKDKRVVLVDDSIVRGTTMENLVKMLKKAGAKEVHIRISSPPFMYPCYYGVDVPSNKELIATRKSAEKINETIGGDTLEYLSVEDLQETAKGLMICTACFTGEYKAGQKSNDNEG
ncbi:MAG: amidophosphoribosyltransferase [Lachnospiraceae bacterium]|nr:amidophosphoribosyltransferase [Lachnospiraceae bacterium]